MVYQSKPDDYYEHDRTALYAFLSWGTRRGFLRVLNVGCAGGADVSILRSLGAARIVGVEPVASAAQQATLRYDVAYHTSFEEWEPECGEKFDLVIFADVLEHLVDPRRSICKAAAILDEHGVMLMSVPNIRHFSILVQLCIKGDWRYECEGILDETHLRFFTLKSFTRLLHKAELATVAMEYFGSGRLHWIDRYLPALGGILRSQIYAIAQPEFAPVTSPDVPAGIG